MTIKTISKEQAKGLKVFTKKEMLNLKDTPEGEQMIQSIKSFLKQSCDELSNLQSDDETNRDEIAGNIDAAIKCLKNFDSFEEH